MDAQSPRLMQALSNRVRPSDASYRQKLVERAAQLDDVIMMGLGDPDAPTPPHVIEAVTDGIAAGRVKYTHPAGMPELRQAIAGYLARMYGLDYAASDVIVTAGTQEAVMLCMLALVDPGDEIILPAPRFTSYDTAIQMLDGVVVPVQTREEDGFALRPDAVEAAITDRTKAVVVVTPNNPTGAVTPPDAIRAIAEICRRHDIVAISDEIYAALLFDGAEHLSMATLPGMRERTITINGFSKSHAMTGWRIGYVAAPAPVIARLIEPRHTLSISASTPSQHAALAAANGPQSAVDEILATYVARRKVLLAGLDALGFTYGTPAGAFYVYVNVSSWGMPATRFCERLLEEARVMVQPGMLFADPDDRYVRFSLLQTEDRIREALDRMRAAMPRIRA
jgi:aminotransferase